MTRKVFLIILLSLSISSLLLSQTPDPAAEVDNPQNANISKKTDEFGQLGECARTGRIDNFLVELMNNPEARGYIIFYQGKDALPSRYDNGANIYLEHIRFRKFDVSRITILNAFRETQTIELWIVPPGAEAPEPTDTVERPAIPEDESYLYDLGYLGIFDDLGSEKFLLQSVIEERQREQEQDVAEQEDAETAEESAKTEAVEIQPTEEPQEEPEEENFYWLKDSFGDRVKAKKDNLGVLVFYTDDETYDVNKIREHIEKGIQKLAEDTEIGSDRFTIIFGGYRSGTEIEMWVVPKTGKMPELKPDERPPEEPDTIDN